MIVLPRQPPRRGAVRVAGWWARAWLRAVEESAHTPEQLAKAGTLARSGEIGPITVGAGRFAAVAAERTVEGAMPTVEPSAFVEAAALPGRRAALDAGDLPHDLAEHAEELGVELLPYGAELRTECTCTRSLCVHGLAVLQQLAWAIDRDPYVLLALRGIDRSMLLARAVEPAEPDDLDVAVEAAVRARRLLAEVDPGSAHPQRAQRHPPQQ